MYISQSLFACWLAEITVKQSNNNKLDVASFVLANYKSTPSISAPTQIALYYIL